MQQFVDYDQITVQPTKHLARPSHRRLDREQKHTKRFMKACEFVQIITCRIPSWLSSFVNVCQSQHSTSLTVSEPTTFDGGSTERNGLRNSGPGLLRDRRLRVVGPKSRAGWAPRMPGRPAPPPDSLPIGLAARSRPCLGRVSGWRIIVLLVEFLDGWIGGRLSMYITYVYFDNNVRRHLLILQADIRLRKLWLFEMICKVMNRYGIDPDIDVYR